jgi:acyl-CoA dehydrogenase
MNSEPESQMEGELAMFRETVARFLDRKAPPERLEVWREQGVVDRELWREAGAAGLLCPSVPPRFGGAGGGFQFELVVLEELGRRGLEGFGLAVHNAIAAPYLLEFATEEQRERWLTAAVRGDLVLAIAMTEPEAGSDLKGIRTRAIRNGATYVINGQKTFISNGQTADLIVVVCKLESGGLGLLVVEAESPGFQRGRNLRKLGREAQDTSELFFDDVRVPADHLLGAAEGLGFAQLSAMLPQERLVIAAMGQAMMERALALTIEHCKTRRAFGKTLFDFQNTRFKLAEARTQIAAGRAFLDAAVADHIKGRLDGTRAAMLKLWIAETEWRVIDDCLQLFGGYGYMDEYPISRLLRDARVDRIHGGTSEIMKTIIARSL